MSKRKMVGIGIGVVVVLMILLAVFGTIRIINTEIGLSNRFVAQLNVVETSLDTMRKTIMNQHNCTKEWADRFIAVVTEQAKGRSGAMAQIPAVEAGKVAAESLPRFRVEAAARDMSFQFSRESEALGIPPALYMQLANSIEGKLAEFKRSQDVLTDVWREHTTYCQKFPNSLFVNGKVKSKPEMITSAATKEAVATKNIGDDLLK